MRVRAGGFWRLCGKGAEESGEVIEGELFCAGLGWEAGVEERVGNGLGGVADVAQVVAEGFSLLGEAGFEECDELGGRDAESVKTGSEDPAEDGGVDFGWGREGLGRQGEEGIGLAVELDGGAEEAVVAAAGRGGDAVCDFALDHEDGEVDGGCGVGEAGEDGRGDVVGQVADDEELLAGFEGDGAKVNGENVLAVQLEVWEAALGGEAVFEVGGEDGVDFNGDEASGACGEELRNGATAGADFDDGAGGDVAEGRDYALDGLLVAEEVLAEFGFLGHGIQWVL